MKEDIPGIIGGLKNAIERGSSIEKAKESFITAGYDAADVEEAAKSFAGEKPVKQAVVPAQPLAALSKTTEKPLPELPKAGAIKQKKKGNFLRNAIIVISIIFFLLILNLIMTVLNIKIF